MSHVPDRLGRLIRGKDSVLFLLLYNMKQSRCNRLLYVTTKHMDEPCRNTWMNHADFKDAITLLQHLELDVCNQLSKLMKSRGQSRGNQYRESNGASTSNQARKQDKLGIEIWGV